MSSRDIAIRVRDVSKRYMMFERPDDRLKQMILPRVGRLLGLPSRQYYREVAAVDNVSFEVFRGETVGIIGRNGSGKSTLLQMIAGTLQPSSGSIETEGRVAALLELGSGFNPEFTGRENVYLNAAILGLSRAETNARIADIERFAEIGIYIDQPVKTYSSGMYVRLAFAVAISVEPDILIVDEALAVGDEAFQRKCFSRIESIRDRGATILFVTHGLQSVSQLCDRALLFDRGELLLEGSPKAVVGQYQRLANADQDDWIEVRDSIISLRRGLQQPDGEKCESVSGEAPSLEKDRGVDVPPSESTGILLPHAEYFDPTLVTRSRVDYDDRGAQVTEFRLVDLGGRQVNVLETGRRYTIEYETQFEQDCADVGFGIGLRTSSGFSLGGANLEGLRHERPRKCMKGSVIVASFAFTCIFLPGTYFVNLAVMGDRGDGERVYLARSIDIFAFRVAPQEVTTAGGIIDFGIQLSLRKLN